MVGSVTRELNVFKAAKYALVAVFGLSNIASFADTLHQVAASYPGNSGRAEYPFLNVPYSIMMGGTFDAAAAHNNVIFGRGCGSSYAGMMPSEMRYVHHVTGLPGAMVAGAFMGAAKGIVEGVGLPMDAGECAPRPKAKAKTIG